MKKTRVMIVEDSAVVRQFLQHIIGEDARLEVVAAVGTAEKALQLLEPLAPDVISMDLHLPGMGGLEATRQVMQRKPTPIVVVSGRLGTANTKRPIEALRAGALTAVEKPVGKSHRDYQALADRLCTQLALMSQVSVIRQRFTSDRRVATTPQQPPAPADDATVATPPAPGSFAVLGLVASTGGPAALQTLLPALGRDFPLPIVLVQHIMSSFHDGFVSWLREIAPLAIHTAADLQPLLPGRVYVAPPERHLVVPGRTLSLRRSAPVCGQRPSGTVLFESLARAFGPQTLAVLLTGMGEDGAAGLQEIRSAGGYTLAEHESTAVVYGMPAAAVRRGAVCESIALAQIAPRVHQLIEPARPQAPARLQPPAGPPISESLS